ncbi:MAG: alpha/beta hydrolase [Microbacterium sp.]|jgi:acetyl esterase|nr:alpha/beta hydrolase [Microbacterium sp.]
MQRRLPVDPFIVAAQRRTAHLPPPDLKDPVARRRQAAENDAQALGIFGIERPDVATQDEVVAVDGHPDVRVRVYWPTPERARPGDGLPLMVALYGGGFTIGGIDWEGWDATFRTRARDAGIVIVAPDYSHAPEVRFPAQPEQCWRAFEWAVDHAHELGADPNRVAIGGTSSGGNLAAAVTLMNRDRSNKPIRLQVLEAPALDLTTAHLDAAGVDARVPGVILRRMALRLVRDYLGPDAGLRRHPYASPLRAASLRGLPPAVVYTAELDALRGDGEAYVRALASAGVPATGVRYIGQTHTSAGLRGWVPAADHLHRDLVATLRTLRDEPTIYPPPKEVAR